MPAAITDKFTHANNGTIAEPAQLSANKTTLDTTASLTLATGWPTDTAIHVEIFKVGTDGSVTAGTVTHWKATLSGTTLSNMTLKGGTNQSYATGDPVILMPTPYWANDVVDGILVEHDQDGTHGAVTATSLATNTITEASAASGVTIDNLLIKDGKLATNDSVVTANVTDSAIIPAKLLTGTGSSWAWQSWTPTINNFTTTGATITGRYVQIGKTIIGEFYILCGAATAFGNTTTIDPPVAPASYYTDKHKLPAGDLVLHDSGTQVFYGNLYWDSTTTSGKLIWNIPNVSGTYPSRTNTTATVPFTIANGDEIAGQFMYEAA